jgi:hypothetical protein
MVADLPNTETASDTREKPFQTVKPDMKDSCQLVKCTEQRQVTSSGSRSDVSQSMPLIPRMPPIAMSTVVSPRTVLPYLVFISFNFACRDMRQL